MSETGNTHPIKLQNEGALLLAFLLNQEGWTKSVPDIIAAGDLLNGILPEREPAENKSDWRKDYLTTDLTDLQFQACKHCITNLVTKKSRLLAPGDLVYSLLVALDFKVPTGEERIVVKIAQLGFKYLRDLTGISEQYESTDDLMTACLVLKKLPTLPEKLLEVSREDELKAWMDEQIEVKFTERQKDLCKKVLKTAAEGSVVKPNKYVPALYTEFGLRET